MDDRLEKLVQVLQEKAGAIVEEALGEVHLLIEARHVVDVLTFLRDGHEFSLLSGLTAVDYWPADKAALPRDLSTDIADPEPFTPTAGAGGRDRSRRYRRRPACT